MRNRGLCTLFSYVEGIRSGPDYRTDYRSDARTDARAARPEEKPKRGHHAARLSDVERCR